MDPVKSPLWSALRVRHEVSCCARLPDAAPRSSSEGKTRCFVTAHFLRGARPHHLTRCSALLGLDGKKRLPPQACRSRSGELGANSFALCAAGEVRVLFPSSDPSGITSRAGRISCSVVANLALSRSAKSATHNRLARLDHQQFGRGAGVVICRPSGRPASKPYGDARSALACLHLRKKRDWAAENASTHPVR
jgi:hypothetical protein